MARGYVRLAAEQRALSAARSALATVALIRGFRVHAALHRPR